MADKVATRGGDLKVGKPIWTAFEIHADKRQIWFNNLNEKGEPKRVDITFDEGNWLNFIKQIGSLNV